MALGTLDRAPPPFFRQGPSSLTKLSFCSALAVFLMVADGRFSITQPIRATVATMLYPMQRALLMPVDVVGDGRSYLSGEKLLSQDDEGLRVNADNDHSDQRSDQRGAQSR